jgi:hypothetical protein
MKYKATQKLLDLIGQGVFVPTMVTNHSMSDGHFECLIGVGKDYSFTIWVDGEMLKNSPDYFEEVK